MFEPNRRDAVGKTLLDYSKLLFAAQLATGFFAAYPGRLRFASLLFLVLLLLVGWWFSPPQKLKEG